MLRNSSPMLLEPSAPQICFAEKMISAPLQVNPDRITPATVFTTACALVLGKETRSIDVLLGRVVSGRQCLPESCRNIVGPCTNDVPVRVQLQGKDSQSLRAALRAVQDQYLEGMPFETLGFDDLKENCTNWPTAAKYYSACSAYQNFDLNPESKGPGESIKMQYLASFTETSTPEEGGDGVTTGYINEKPVHDMDMTSVPDPDDVHVRISIGANRKVCDEDTVRRMLLDLCDAIQLLNSALEE